MRELNVNEICQVQGGAIASPGAVGAGGLQGGTMGFLGGVARGAVMGSARGAIFGGLGGAIFGAAIGAAFVVISHSMR
ncbi:hypothetical protein [Pseudoalteromonas sp. JB197]|uniref:hypothetical protein n=1 Tax=Pseudoalteromonas sp. JB197 TaxID=1434839 RepID=UPI00097EB0D8|nr:hypothetical protein [Pseudoalteromonas sp. JB197]SJN23027.1 hypothetical protein CZ797_03240 [Pseudoalteromonas sp. JB197]